MSSANAQLSFIKRRGCCCYHLPVNQHNELLSNADEWNLTSWENLIDGPVAAVNTTATTSRQHPHGVAWPIAQQYAQCLNRMTPTHVADDNDCEYNGYIVKDVGLGGTDLCDSVAIPDILYAGPQTFCLFCAKAPTHPTSRVITKCTTKPARTEGGGFYAMH